MKRFNKILISAALITMTQSALPAQAQMDADSRAERGLFLGLNGGVGGSMFEYKDSTRSISEEAKSGAIAGMRIGYAFNPKFALSFEGFGFGRSEDDDKDWGLGAGVLAATWHPAGKGFFVRGGIGGGGGDFIHPDTDEEITVEDRFAWLFSVGYEWWVCDNFSLGLSADTFGFDADGATGFEDDHIGASGLTMQLNWHL